MVANASTVAFSSIPGSYRNLTGKWWAGKSTTTGSSLDILEMVINSDTTITDYYGNFITTIGASITPTENLGTVAYVFMGGLVQATPTHGSSGTLQIPNYTSTTVSKQILVFSCAIFSGSTSTNRQWHTCTLWTGTAAISNLTFQSSGGNVATGTGFLLAGEP